MQWTIGNVRHRWRGCWQWAPVATVSAARSGVQRIRHRSKGAMRTTLRHLVALRAPSLVNRSFTLGSCTEFSGYQLWEQRIRHRSRGSAQKTLGHTDALRASLPGNRDCTLGNRLYLHQAQPRRQRIRHWSRGTEQKTLRQSVALPAALPMNCGRTLGNHLPLPMGISADATDTWATYFIFGYWRHGSRILMAKLGTQEREAVDTTSDQGMDSRRAWAHPSRHWGAAPRSIHESACTGLATEARMHTYMDHLRLREEEREGKEAGESEEGKERKGEGESKSTVESESTDWSA